MRQIFCTILFCVIANYLQAQSDTTVSYLGFGGKSTTKEEAAKYVKRFRENDHWRELLFDLSGNLMQSAGYKDAAAKELDGQFIIYHKNSSIMTLGQYANNKKTGLWKSYSPEKKLTDSTFYKNDFILGLSISWDKDGNVMDSSMLNESGNGFSHGYWSDGKHKHTGQFINGKKDGGWTYYYKTGLKCQEVMFTADSAVSFICYDEQGTIQKDDCYFEREANYKGGEGAWKRYLSKKLSNADLPKDYYKGKIFGTVVIQFVVASDGKIKDAQIIKSVDPGLDRIALNVLTESPVWEPAIQYNRKVNAYRVQPITFPQAR